MSLLLAVAAFLLLLSLSVTGPLVIVLFYCWVLLSYTYYRVSRQEELLEVLAMAAEAGTPLAPTIRAFLQDRPHGKVRNFIVCCATFFVFPGYYWLWHRGNNFDQKLARLASLLEQGISLAEALRSTPGTAEPTTIVAAAVGESTARLGTCLRHSARIRLSSAYAEALPRLLYPVMQLMILVGIVSYWMVFLQPKMDRIFRDFAQAPGMHDVRLPKLTEYLKWTWGSIEDNVLFVTLCILVTCGFGTWLALDSRLRWYLPFVGRVHRMASRGRILKTLGVMLEAGKPAPEALSILGDSGAFPAGVRERLRAARSRIIRGEALADALEKTGLLPGNMAPLVRAAQRARNLPWALGELGDHLGDRAVRLVQRISVAGLASSVAVMGIVVGLAVAAMFLPLIGLVNGLAE